MKPVSNSLQSFLLPTVKGKKEIDIKNIIRIEAKSNYTRLFFNTGCSGTAGKTTWVLAKALKWVESKLPAHQFIRIHRTHLVNKEYMQPLKKSNCSTLFLLNGESLAISRRKQGTVKKMLSS